MTPIKRPPRPRPRRTPVAALSIVLAIALAQSSCNILAYTIATALNLGVAVAQTKLGFLCIPEGTAIDTPGGPVAIEDLRAGDEVIGFEGDPVEILQVHQYREDPSAERFLKLTFDGGATVDACDQHRIGGIPAGRLSPGDMVAGHRVATIESYGGVARTYDLLTEDDGYRIAGVPVNSMIEEMIRASIRVGRTGDR